MLNTIALLVLSSTLAWAIWLYPRILLCVITVAIEESEELCNGFTLVTLT